MRGIAVACSLALAIGLMSGGMASAAEPLGNPVIATQSKFGAHYQDVCPACRRKNLALTQDALWRAERADGEKE